MPNWRKPMPRHEIEASAPSDRRASNCLKSTRNRFDHFIHLSCGQRYTEKVDQAVQFLGDLTHRMLKQAA
jgi:hypothetical protein